ncbi:hypothetical protein BJV77DRAFT_802629 [Russula vinacea]|nr:hypothetical protein BJV77DRAFT_802629 [Russula vinacea]
MYGASLAQEQRNLDKCRRCRTKFDGGQSDGAEQKVTTSLQDTSKHPSSTLPSPTSSIRSTQSLESGDNGGPIGRETRRAFLNGGARILCWLCIWRYLLRLTNRPLIAASIWVVTFRAYLLGHEGPGSLHSYLSERGWITTLSTGVQELALFATFKITLHLSQNGFQNYREVET